MVRLADLSLTLKLLNLAAGILGKFAYSWKLGARTEDHSECAGHIRPVARSFKVVSVMARDSGAKQAQEIY